MSQIPDSSDNLADDLSRTDDHLQADRLSAICSSLQFHLSEPSEEANQRRWHAVCHPETDPQVLEHIASRGNPKLAKRIAEHPRATAATLSRLACHDHYEVRAALADNQNIPLELQWKLAQDVHPDVRFALAQSYHIDQIVLATLLDDDNPFVAHRAKTTLQRKNVAANQTPNLPGNADARGSSRRSFASG